MKKYGIGVKEERNIYVQQNVGTNWVGSILRRNCRLKHITGGKLERRYPWREDKEELPAGLNETRR